MFRVFILFCVLSTANFEKQKFKRQVYIPRKPRPNEASLNTEYVNNTVGEKPEIITAIDNNNIKPTAKYTEIKEKEDNLAKHNVAKRNATDCYNSWRMRNKDNEVFVSPQVHDEYVEAKTKCLQLKEMEHVANNTKPTSEIHSELNPKKKMLTPYLADKEFVVDNEDVRAGSRNTYNGWPYSYNGPYEYQNKNVNTKTEKEKEKHYLDVNTTLAPAPKRVKENVQRVKENVPGDHISNAASSSDPVIDNPNYGDEQYLTFVANDYSNKHYEQDPLIGKDLPWGEEFDYGLSSRDVDDERHSRHFYKNNPMGVKKSGASQVHTNIADKGSSTKEGYDSNREYEKYRKGDNKESNEDSNYHYNGQHETEFKNFADAFANKFGSEGSNKNSKYLLKTNQDTGQKRKGFKRVYHKDEYQEDNEFYDNTNKNALSEESGGSTFNVGGSQSFLQSQAAASAGNEGNSLTKTGKEDYNTFENQEQVNKNIKERDNEINRYRNIAKDAAYSNYMDYRDNFRK